MARTCPLSATGPAGRVGGLNSLLLIFPRHFFLPLPFVVTNVRGWMCFFLFAAYVFWNIAVPMRRTYPGASNGNSRPVACGAHLLSIAGGLHSTGILQLLFIPIHSFSASRNISVCMYSCMSILNSDTILISVSNISILTDLADSYSKYGRTYSKAGQ